MLQLDYFQGNSDFQLGGNRHRRELPNNLNSVSRASGALYGARVLYCHVKPNVMGGATRPADIGLESRRDISGIDNFVCKLGF